MAADRRRVGVDLRVVNARAAVLGCERGACHDDRTTPSGKPCLREVLPGRGPDV